MFFHILREWGRITIKHIIDIRRAVENVPIESTRGDDVGQPDSSYLQSTKGYAAYTA